MYISIRLGCFTNDLWLFQVILLSKTFNLNLYITHDLLMQIKTRLKFLRCFIEKLKYCKKVIQYWFHVLNKTKVHIVQFLKMYPLKSSVSAVSFFLKIKAILYWSKVKLFIFEFLVLLLLVKTTLRHKTRSIVDKDGVNVFEM